MSKKKQESRSSKFMSFSVPAMLVGVVMIMIIPIPAWMLDVLLSFNITLSLVVLFVSLQMDKPLEFSAYPALLLITTMFRLAMNISSTRLILLYGSSGLDAAGGVIQAFGTFVLGGSFVIGVIIFLIIVLINFMVITKGSGRIAEVAARFTLDAMPGKQMAIDSDLNSGLINESEAKARRKELTQEAEFYGAMDGASKFVRGDAIAGIIITVVNIIGGLFIGVVQDGMEWLQAAETYTLLTVGDGLVSQIPALIVSTSAGIIVARAGSGDDLGTEVGGQLTSKSRPLALASVTAGVFALIPGLPFIPFVLLAGTTGILAYAAKQKTEEKTRELEKIEFDPAESPEPLPGSADEVKGLLSVDMLELEVGYELVPLVDAGSGGDLIERIRALRRQFALDFGFIVPAIHIRDNVRLASNNYRLMLKGVEVASGAIKPHHHLAMDPGGVSTKIPGTPTKEPAFGLDALWISDMDKERAQLAGYTVVDPATVITTHVTEVIRKHAYEIIGRQEVQELVDNLAKQCPKLVEDTIPSVLSLGLVQQVLVSLLKEEISIRDLRTIVETLADYAPTIKSVERLTELVRKALSRSITAKYTDEQGLLSLASLNPATERSLNDCLQVTDQGSYLALDPSMAQKLIAKMKGLAEKFAQSGKTPVLLAPMNLRAALYHFTERFLPGYAVVSHQEILPTAKVQSLGVVSVED